MKRKSQVKHHIKDIQNKNGKVVEVIPEQINNIGNVLKYKKRAEELYNIKSQLKLKEYKLSKSDEHWMKKLMQKGTFKDKISAISIYIRDNPENSLLHLENLLSMHLSKNKKDKLTVFTSLRDLFKEVLLNKKKMSSFIENLRQIKNKETIEDDKLASFFYEDKLMKIYQNFIQILQKESIDSLIFYKKAIVDILIELASTVPFSESTIVENLINKFGDREKTLINHLNSNLSKILMIKPSMIEPFIKSIESFIYRPNQMINGQIYVLGFLNSIDIKKLEANGIKKILALYFSLLKKLIGKKDIEITASRLMSMILRGFNKLFPNAKELGMDTEISGFLRENEMILYKVIHSCSNFKVKIQMSIFIFQILSLEENISNKFYRLIYELLLNEQMWHSSVNQLFFDLLFMVIRSDSDYNRIAAYVKRLLQSAIHSECGFAVTTLIFLQKIIIEKPFLKLLISSNQLQNNDDEEELFEDAPDSDDEEKIPEAKVENEEKVYSKEYDFAKREPLFSNANSTFLWELQVFLNIYHPTLKKYSKLITQRTDKDIDYEGNPLLDFSLTSFLDRFIQKQPKKGKSTSFTAMINNKKIRRSKYEEALSIENMMKAEQDLREDEMFFKKFFDEKDKLGKKPKSKQSKKKGSASDDEMDDYADELIKKEMVKAEGDPNEDDEFDEEFEKMMMEDEDVSGAEDDEDDGEFSQDEDFDDAFLESEEEELDYMKANKKRKTK